VEAVFETKAKQKSVW